APPSAEASAPALPRAVAPPPAAPPVAAPAVTVPVRSSAPLAFKRRITVAPASPASAPRPPVQAPTSASASGIPAPPVGAGGVTGLPHRLACPGHVLLANVCVATNLTVN